MKDPTFLFTDIEGSTELLRRLGTGYATVLERHRRTIRAVVSASGGHEVDTAGDAFFVVFDDSAPAVNAALAAQLRLAAENRTSEVQVKVRMGLHTGSATLVSGGYVGLAVHQAARICHAAHGGLVLVSEDLVEELPAPLPAGAFLIDLGFHRLKDFETAALVPAGEKRAGWRIPSAPHPTSAGLRDTGRAESARRPVK